MEACGWIPPFGTRTTEMFALRGNFEDAVNPTAVQRQSGRTFLIIGHPFEINHPTSERHQIASNG
jgi:hypothetical protein